ncbi:MAG TPA: hypothetical protein VE981_22005, partial [Planctomycetota bacterium]|nr:hypothetical protein [Planctomycetota bacterium]
SFFLSLGGERVRVDVDADPRCLLLLKPLNLSPRGASGPPDLELTWSDGRGLLRDGGRVVHRSRSREDLVLWCEWLATREALRRLRPRVALLHAAWVARGTSGILIAGRHGSGKTSLGAALALRRGWTLYGDDVTLLRQDGRLQPLERPLRIKPGSSRRLPELRAGRRIGLVPIARFSRPGSARLRAIVFLEGTRGGLKRRRLSPGLATARLAKLTMNFREDSKRILGALAAMTGKADAVAIRGGSIEDRCDLLESLL